MEKQRLESAYFLKELFYKCPSPPPVELNLETNVDSSRSRPLVLDEGGGGDIDDNAESVQAASRGVQSLVISTTAISTWIWCVLSIVYPPHASLLKSHRGYAASEVYLIIDVGQISRNGKDGETSSVTAEVVGMHDCVADRYSS